MNVSQQINHVNENNYDDDITVTDVPKGYFLAVTSITLPEGSATREVTVQLLPLEQAPGGTRTTNTGLFVRKAGEAQIKVTVQQDGNTLAENTSNYP
ncbi:hypothetical protein [Lewinella cohaerens]|uniref:hypothetical protein n=1 Tax=Lewinella cohaerens TaxID=70995 RepID=UPI00036C225D|nr:hypothetical protein [Lewinella cohaerens]